MNVTNASTSRTGQELRLRDLFVDGRAPAFPCDAQGQDDLDARSPRARNSHFHACTAIGRDFTMPVVSQSAAH